MRTQIRRARDNATRGPLRRDSRARATDLHSPNKQIGLPRAHARTRAVGQTEPRTFAFEISKQEKRIIGQPWVQGILSLFRKHQKAFQQAPTSVCFGHVGKGHLKPPLHLLSVGDGVQSSLGNPELVFPGLWLGAAPKPSKRLFHDSVGLVAGLSLVEQLLESFGVKGSLAAFSRNLKGPADCSTRLGKRCPTSLDDMLCHHASSAAAIKVRRMLAEHFQSHQKAPCIEGFWGSYVL